MIDAKFYRKIVIEHMVAAGIEPAIIGRDLTTADGVKGYVKSIGKYSGRTSGKSAANAQKIAFWAGQLYILDYIDELQNSFVAEQRG